MIDIRKILCPVDFSGFSKRALDQAVAIARRYESGVTALYVCPSVLPPFFTGGIPPNEPTALTDADRQCLLSQLREFADVDRAAVQIRTVVREGNAVGEILEEAAALKPDLLTIGTHGRSGFERLLLGSVTEKLLRKAGCPVLTVPCHRGDSVAAVPGVFKRILCPIDFSNSSRAALRYATSVAEENDAQLVVLYVVPNDIVPLPGQSPDDGVDHTISVAEFFIRREEHVQRLLQEAVPASVRAYCSVEPMLAHGKPATEILRVARERGSDLIAIGVRGRGAADLAVFGSTTQHVVRHAACPVLTIREG